MRVCRTGWARLEVPDMDRTSGVFIGQVEDWPDSERIGRQAEGVGRRPWAGVVRAVRVRSTGVF